MLSKCEYIHLHSLDPQVVAVTIGCGISHKNYNTMIQGQFNLPWEEQCLYRKAYSGVCCIIMRFYESSPYIKTCNILAADRVQPV